jgi:hypothetical protein
MAKQQLGAAPQRTAFPTNNASKIEANYIIIAN